MKIIAVLLSIAALTGCVSQVTLISQDSKRYEMKVDQMARKLSTTIDGVFYTGSAVGSEAVGFSSGQTFGLKPTFGTSTTIVQGNSGQALLTATTGQYLECGYTKSGMTIIGNCVGNDGRKFVLTTM
jgi:hypothetical protein